MSEHRAVLLGVLLFAGTVLAFTGTVEAQSREQARELFDRGSVAMDESQFARARDLFRRSLTLFPNAGTAFNLAVALERTGEFVEAVRVFGALEEGAFGELQREQRREVQRLAGEAEAAITVLTLRGPTIDGFEVRVDGERFELGSVRIDPGPHVILATAPRHEAFERRVDASPGEPIAIDIELALSREARLGTLIVEAEDATHSVEIVGVDRGVGRLRRELEPGTYQVVVRDGRRVRRSSVELTGGDRLRVQLDLERASRPWLWIGLSALVVGAAAAATGIALTRDDVAPPIRDDVYGTISTLQHR